MAELKLNVTTSIVDFLKSQGKPSDFSSRKSLYESSGLADRLGPYVSSGSQNVAFLKQLNTQSTSAAASPTTPKVVPIDQVDTSTFSKPQQDAFNYAKSLIPGAETPPKPAAPVPTTAGTSGISASEALASIPGVPSMDEILGKVFESPEFQNFKYGEEAQNAYDIGSAASEKQKLEATAAGETRAFIDKMGRRGLFFSGETQGGIQSLVESLAASKLGVDRKLANQLIQSDVKTREQIFKKVENIVKDAQAGRKEAISSLEKVGLTVIGDKIVPTLAAQAADRAERNAELAIEREARLAETAAFNQAATEERLRLSEEAALRAERALSLRENDAAGGGTVKSGGLVISNKSIGDAAVVLNNARGPDGWTDPNLYLGLYTDWTSKGGLPQDFISSFPPSSYVNPQNSTLPAYLQNKKGSTIIINPGSISEIIKEVSATE